MNPASWPFRKQKIIEIECTTHKWNVLSESRVVAFNIYGIHLLSQQLLRFFSILFDVIRSLEAGKLALVLQDFKSAIINLDCATKLSYIFNLNIRMVFELQIVHSLCIGIKPFVGRKKEPVRLLLVIKRQLLEIFECSLNGRHCDGKKSRWWESRKSKCCGVWLPGMSLVVEPSES
jgi:hypothetical protein